MRLWTSLIALSATGVASALTPIPECGWSGNEVCKWSTSNVSALKLNEYCGVIVPVAKDNYVADNRTNKYDTNNTLDRPKISISATKRVGNLPGPTTVTKNTSWIAYTSNPNTIADEITLDSFGVFDLVLDASDYRKEALCTGCVAVVDDFRPKATNACPNANNSNSTLAAMIEDEAKFKKFYTEGVLNNGVENKTTHANEREDDKQWSRMDDFGKGRKANTTQSSFDDNCFEPTSKTDLLASAKSKLGVVGSVLCDSLQCERSCSKSITLRELYVPYECSHAYADPTVLTGAGDSCSFSRTLTLTPAEIASVTIAISNGANEVSKKTLAAVKNAPAFNSSMIYKSLPCKTVGSDGCVYTAQLKDLFNRTTTSIVTLPANTNIDDFVYWQYGVAVDQFKPWNDNDTLTFTQDTTEVFVRAWTHCGQLMATGFAVKLFPHSNRNVCNNFSARWVENSPNPRPIGQSYYCTYPKSDFTLFTYTYDGTENLNHIGETVKGKYTDVKCYIKAVDSSTSLDQVTATQIPLTWNTSEDSIQISKQFAIELVRDPTTAIDTNVEVSCNFTYLHFDSNKTEVDPCKEKFSLSDCDAPTLETKGDESVCKLGECLNPAGAPGAFETCAGTVVTAQGLQTTLKAEANSCCSECSTTLHCLAFPIATEIKRCQPNSGGAMAMAMEEVEAKGARLAGKAASPTMTALAGVSALVAIVALVVVKARGSSRKEQIDDVYQSLLD